MCLKPFVGLFIKSKLDVFICVIAMPVSRTLSEEKGAFKITR